jgi:hypothetical protein
VISALILLSMDKFLKEVNFSVIYHKLQCIARCKVLSTESMKSSKLIRRLETKHLSLKHKPVKLSQRKLKALNDQQTSNFKATLVNNSFQLKNPRLKLLTLCL